MTTRSITGSLSLVGAIRHEESLSVYREEEANPASRLPFPCDLQRPLDGGGADPHPAREVTLANLDAHAYHLRAPLLLSLLLSERRGVSRFPAPKAISKKILRGRG